MQRQLPNTTKILHLGRLFGHLQPDVNLDLFLPKVLLSWRRLRAEVLAAFAGFARAQSLVRWTLEECDGRCRFGVGNRPPLAQ